MALIAPVINTELVTELPFNKPYISTLSFVAALGGLLFGFDTAIISGTQPFIIPYFNLSDVMLGQVVGSLLLGSATGALIAGKLSDIFGRKKILVVCAFLFALSAIGAGLSNTVSALIINRIIGGIAVGAAAMVSPMYIAEIAPAQIRGKLVSYYQLAIVIGILLAFASNYFLSGLTANWRWMFASQSAPAILFLVSLLVVSESPRWLVKKKKTKEARAILTKIGGEAYAEEEMVSITDSFHNQQKENWKDLLQAKYRAIIIIGIMVAVFSQVTGINSILYYAPMIFKKMGSQTDTALLQTLCVGVTNFAFTFAAISLMDKIGRKKLFITGNIIMAAALLIAALCFHYQYLNPYIILPAIMLFIAGFASAVGPTTWVYLSEIFPNNIRGIAMSVATLGLWIANYAANALFPVMLSRMGTPLTLTTNAILCIIYIIYIKRNLAETKGMTLEEIEKILIK